MARPAAAHAIYRVSTRFRLAVFWFALIAWSLFSILAVWAEQVPSMRTSGLVFVMAAIMFVMLVGCGYLGLYLMDRRRRQRRRIAFLGDTPGLRWSVDDQEMQRRLDIRKDSRRELLTLVPGLLLVLIAAAVGNISTSIVAIIIMCFTVVAIVVVFPGLILEIGQPDLWLDPETSPTDG